MSLSFSNLAPHTGVGEYVALHANLCGTTLAPKILPHDDCDKNENEDNEVRSAGIHGELLKTWFIGNKCSPTRPEYKSYG
jgi:hypothetical protein